MSRYTRGSLASRTADDCSDLCDSVLKKNSAAMEAGIYLPALTAEAGIIHSLLLGLLDTAEDPNPAARLLEPRLNAQGEKTYDVLSLKIKALIRLLTAWLKEIKVNAHTRTYSILINTHTCSHNCLCF